MAGGRWILESGAIQGGDPFSFTAEGAPWFNHEWLAETLFFLVYRAGGLEAVYLLRSALVVGAFAALPLWGACRRGVPLTLASAVVLLCSLAAEWRSFFDARAYLFSYLGLSVTLLLVREYLRSGRAAWVWAGVPLTALWANLHGGYILGPLVLLLGAAGCVLQDRSRARIFLVAGLASLAAALLNPWGVRLLAFPFSLTAPSTFTVGLNEWQPPQHLGAQWPFTALAFFSLLALGIVVPRLSPAEGLWALGFLGAGLVTWRHIPLAALALAHLLPDIAQRLAVRFPSISARASVLWASRAAWAALAAGFAVALAVRAEGGAVAWSMERTHFPADAATFLEANPQLPKRLYNPYEWGGYLVWKLYPAYRVFIDGRANTVYTQRLYAEALWVQYGEAWAKRLEEAGLGGFLRGDWTDVLERHGVDLVLCNRLLGDLWLRMKDRAGWVEIYRDPVAAVFLRATPENRRLLPGLVQPDTPGSRLQEAQEALERGDEGAAAEALRGALALDPRCAPAHAMLGVLLLRRGDREKGRDHLLRALRLDPRTPGAHYNLGICELEAGRRGAALRHFAAELEIDPGHPLARRHYERLRRGHPYPRKR